MHELAFNPTNPNEALCGNDGGVQKTTNILSTPVAWTFPANYQTVQYYYVTLDPDAGRNNFAGGAQDNGVRIRDVLGVLGTPNPDSNFHQILFSADGGAVGISRLDQQSQQQYLYGGYQLGNIFRYRLTAPQQLINIRPNGLTVNSNYGSGSFGEFVTNFRLDPENTEDLYYVNFNRLFRTSTASSVAAGGWVELTGVPLAIPFGSTAAPNSIRAMGFSRGPYNNSHSLYLGTTSGKILRIDDPRNFDPNGVPADITPIGLVGNVQDIAVNPNNDAEIMAVVSNFGVTSGGTLTNITNIWWTNNAKSLNPTWRSAEGNLANGFISARTCAIVVKKSGSNTPVTEYYVGTGAGLYSTADLEPVLTNGNTPNWEREGANVLNLAVVQHLAYRPADNMMVVGTHGNGMYYTQLGTPNFVPNTGTPVIPVTNDRNFIRNVFPTVTAGTVNFQTGTMTGIRKINIQLTDVMGRTVYSRQSAYTGGQVNLGALAAGNYVLTIYSDDRKYRHVQKVVKQ